MSPAELVDVDEVAVQRRVAGDTGVHLTAAETRAAWQECEARGWSAREIGARLGVSSRQVVRWRAGAVVHAPGQPPRRTPRPQAPRENPRVVGRGLAAALLDERFGRPVRQYQGERTPSAQVVWERREAWEGLAPGPELAVVQGEQGAT